MDYRAGLPGGQGPQTEDRTMAGKRETAPKRKVEAYGEQGMKSKPWRRVFASQEAFEKWAASEAAENITVHGFRDYEG